MAGLPARHHGRRNFRRRRFAGGRPLPLQRRRNFRRAARTPAQAADGEGRAAQSRRAQARRFRRAYRSRYREVPRPAAHEGRRRRGRFSESRIRGQRHDVRAGRTDKSRATVHRRRQRRAQARQARQRFVGDIYAAREVMEGHAYLAPGADYEEFASRFEFEETPDQQSAIDDVIRDLTRVKPMDRLICGDAGFGKTEVALRAAFIAVMDGRQVAVLVPTTILAEQHWNTFRDRFKDYPVRVEMVSRFRSHKENKAVIEEAANGKVDIIVGTHRLLSSDVQFPRLGLLVIDEEHRFGVVDKEKIKKLKKLVPVLTMTATPIPRTLHMA